MPGGTLNIEAAGESNIILNGNPKKSFFKATYAKYHNFGMQKFRLDFEGSKQLQLTEDTTFKFKIPRYADLLTDTYFVVKIPSIWSPIGIPESSVSLNINDISQCQPYEFKWIENLGTQLIRSARVLINGQVIQEFTGQYLNCMMQRDFTKEKRDLYDEMTGNTKELNDPANYNNRNGNYPNASYMKLNRNSWTNGVEPSIRGRNLYIPINIWFTLLSTSALPLVSLQYSEVEIEITCRPIKELFVVRDVRQYMKNRGNPDRQCDYIPYVSPDDTSDFFNFYYFLYEPPENTWGITGTNYDTINNYYPNKRYDWNADIHLISTYVYLDNLQVKEFALNKQCYLIKEVHEQKYYNIIAKKQYLQTVDTNGLVTSWMWYFQRSDVNLRNEWSNYNNWDYNYLPYPCTSYLDISNNKTSYPDPYRQPNIPQCPESGQVCGLYLTGPQHIENEKNIMTSWGLLLDGEVRETRLEQGTVNYMEKYFRSNGNLESGVYSYNFCIDTDPFNYQPSGAINLSKFDNIGFEFTTIEPPDVSGDVFVSTLCNNLSEGEIGPEIITRKPYWTDYKYSYNLHIMEERYNILTIENGVGNLALAR